MNYITGFKLKDSKLKLLLKPYEVVPRVDLNLFRPKSNTVK